MDLEGKRNILDMTYDELETFIVSLGLKKFAAKQIYIWLHQKMVRKFSDMTNISVENRQLLAENAHIPYLEQLEHQVSKKDKTEKYLFELEDKLTIETVLIKHKERNTVCVSTQVGCAVRCEFCATGIDGFKRNLSLSEILNQIYFIQKRLIKKNEEVTNVVFMGMGEPLLNLENLINSIKILSDEDGLHISLRKIVVSTSGIIPGIVKLMEEKLPIGLAISLHAPTDEKRSKLISINRQYPMDDLFSILQEYQRITKRRITFEYILIKDLNVSYTDADLLAQRMFTIDHTLNLIPYNKVEEKVFDRPTPDKIKKFYDYLLEKHKVNVTMRQEKGADIDGACGQLREKHDKAKVRKAETKSLAAAKIRKKKIGDDRK